MTRPNRIKIQHSSLEFNQSANHMEHDAHVLFSRGSHIIGGTEASPNTANYHILPQVGSTLGYHVFMSGSGSDSWCAVRKDFGKVVSHDSYKVVAKQSGAADHGGHSERDIVWLAVDAPGLPQIVFGTSHWVTNPSHNRGDEQQQSTEAFKKFIAKVGAGKRLAFLSGDMNLDDQKVSPLSPDITTCWDEIKKWPPTHGGPRSGTIDVVASYDLDQQVKCVHAQTFRAPKQFKDHYDVVATYEIR